MDLQQLRVFWEAARSGGFTKASEKLHISQSTISLHVKHLEEEMGTPLFLRTQRHAYLNEAGQVLLQHTERIFQEVEEAKVAVRELSTMERGTIRLGAGATTVTYLLPPILAAYQRKYPNVKLIVTTDSSESLASALHEQRLDLAILMLPVQPRNSIEVLPLLTEKLAFVMSTGHPMAGKDVIDTQEISSLPLIAYPAGSAMQVKLDKHFSALGITPEIVMEIENIEVIKALVRSGIGVGVIPSCSMASAMNPGLHEFRISDLPFERDLALALPGTHVLTRLLMGFAANLAKRLSGKSISEIRAAAAARQLREKPE